MKVYFIGAGPGDPELITIKGFKAIQRSGYCIYAGSLVNKELLNALPSHAKIYDSSDMRLEEMVVVFKEAFGQNADVARDTLRRPINLRRNARADARIGRTRNSL